jgi:hypothetical protein
MEHPVFFPNIKTKSTKDLIIRLLTQEKSLSNQVIFNNIKKQFGVSVTYQAVRQALTELKEAGVLEKSGKEYSLSTAWINSLYDYSSLLKEKYVDKAEIKIVDKNTKEIHLNSLNEMGQFILYSFKEHFFDLESKNDLYMLIHHLWFPFIKKEKREALKSFFSKNNNYVYVANKSFLDRILLLFYKRYGKVSLGIKFDDFFDVIIQGDCVAKIYMPKELRERMNKFYKTKNFLSFKVIDEFSDMNFEKYPIEIIITRDKEMAAEIKSRVVLK